MNYRYNSQIVGYTMLRKDRGTPTGGVEELQYLYEITFILQN